MKHYCQDCGVELYNRDHYLCDKCYLENEFDTCECGNSKRVEYDLCRECDKEKSYQEQKSEYGYSYCPLCGKEFLFSPYLHEAIQNEQTRLVANLITHYRHNHQKSWNKSCHYIARNWGEDAYQRAKERHNNQAKRQILRYCESWINENGIKKSNFLELQNNDEKTIELVNKKFVEI